MILLRAAVTEKPSVEILEREVESYGRVVTEHAAPVASPEGQDAFFTDRAVDEIEHSFELLLSRVVADDGDVALLGLEEELGSLDWGHDGVDDARHHGSGE